MNGKQVLNGLQRDFFKSSTKLFRMGLDANAIAVYCYISSCTEDFNPSIRLISQMLGLSRSTVSRTLSALEQRNMIAQRGTRQPGFRAPYYLTHPDEWRTDVQSG